MNECEKVILRFLALPRNFSWQELETMLEGFGYTRSVGGKSECSRVAFFHEKRNPIILHKRHPTPVLKRYQVLQIREMLSGEGLV